MVKERGEIVSVSPPAAMPLQTIQPSANGAGSKTRQRQKHIRVLNSPWPKILFRPRREAEYYVREGQAVFVGTDSIRMIEDHPKYRAAIKKHFGDIGAGALPLHIEDARRVIAHPEFHGRDRIDWARQQVALYLQWRPRDMANELHDGAALQPGIEWLRSRTTTAGVCVRAAEE
jgi:hypothetical protein